MMEDFEEDDDFGDLYADVEAHASSIVNAIQENNGDDDYIRNPNANLGDAHTSGNDDVERSPFSKANGAEYLAVDDGSDSEDDLNIVLGDGGRLDPSCFNNAVHSNSECIEGGEEMEEENGGNGGKCLQYLQYKFIKPQRASTKSNFIVKDCKELASHSSTLGRGDLTFDGHNHNKDVRPMLGQSRQTFTLPRSRTILDINIDAFENKPWRHPGADITDFFNFGFNEESWKTYCNRLDECRWINTTDCYVACNQAGDSGTGHHTVAQEVVSSLTPQCHPGMGASSHTSKNSFAEQKLVQVPKGRAIQVEDGTGDRRPSMDVRSSFDRDSNVVIQIKMQDSEDDDPGVDHVNCSVDGISDNREEEGAGCVLSFDNASEDEDIEEQFDSFGSASYDEDAEGEFKGHNNELDLPVLNRSPRQDNVCAIAMKFRDNESVQISGIDGYDSKELTISNSKGIDEELEGSSNSRKGGSKAISSSTPVVRDTRSSQDEWSRPNRDSSSSAGNSGRLRDDAVVNVETSFDVKSSSLPTDELVASYMHRSGYTEIRGTQSKRAGHKYGSRHRSPIQRNLEPFNYLDKRPSSDTNHLEDPHHSATRKSYVSDSYNGNDFMYRREFEPFYSYGERVSDHITMDGDRKYLCQKRETLNGDADRDCQKRSDRSYHCPVPRFSRIDDEVMETDCSPYEKGFTVRRTSPFPCNDSRNRTLNHYSSLEQERSTSWKRKEDDLRYGNKFKHPNYLFGGKYKDNIPHSDRYGYLSEYQDELCESHPRRTFKKPKNCRRRSAGLSVISNKLFSVDSDTDGDEYCRCTNCQSYSFCRCEESCLTNDRRWHDNVSPRQYLYDGHERNGNRAGTEKWLDDYACCGNDYSGIKTSLNDFHGRVCYGRRHDLQSEILHLSKDEHKIRRWDEEFHSKAEHNIRRWDEEFHSGDPKYLPDRLTRQKNLDGNHGFHHVLEPSDDSQVIHHIIRRGEREQTSLRCQDSAFLHLFAGKGKSAGRRSKGGELLCADMNGKTKSESDLQKRASKNINRSCTKRVKLKSKQSDEKLCGYLSNADQEEAIDIEEGQIVNEGNTPAEKERVCEDMACTDKVKKLHKGNATDRNMVHMKHDDNPRILELMMKMERRRERFRDSSTLKKDTDTTPKVVIDFVAEPVETKQERPVRKRRWGGGYT